MSPATQQTICLLRQKLIVEGRPMDEQNLRIALRSVGAIEPTEIATLVKQTNGFVQFYCYDGTYLDAPVVTVHVDGTWERV